MVHKHEVPVLSFISDCVGMFSAQAKEAKVSISIVNAAEESGLSFTASQLLENDTVFIDKFKMDQVLRNLISNALKFTPHGGSVTVTCTFIPESTKLHLPIQLYGPPYEETHDRSQRNKRHMKRTSITRSFMSFLRKSSAKIRIDSVPDRDILRTRGKLIIIVKDNGTGMLEKDYSRLFKEIVQFNPEVLQAGGGSGLGLWITKGIVDLHQGEISVYSEGLGYGSSFTVELPMGRRAPSNPVALLSSASSRSLPSGRRRKSSIFFASRESFPPEGDSKSQLDVGDMRCVYRLLIVDDSVLNRKMLLKTLRAAGHVCDEAEDGLIAVAKVKEMISSDAKAYTAILMDFVMPNMDGPTATKEIRALGYTAPIFGVTGNTLDSDKEYFMNNGADKVLAKPLDMDIFNRAMAWP